ncbi:hypothetical protein FRB99_003312, partial [Tulasnella sp. 403]
MLYSAVLAQAHRTLGPRFGIPDTSSLPEDADEVFGQSIANWEPFPDTISALARLSKHYKL